MTPNRTYAVWVRPIASVLSADRQAVIEFARSLAPDAWDAVTEIERWTRKDLLAHLAGGNDQMVQTILHAVTTGTPPERAALQPDTDAENAARVEERRSWPIEKLIAELERDGNEVQDLLAKLTDKDEDLFLDGLSMSLGQFLRIVEHERHDVEHLNQMDSK